jgi:DNA polymerase-3 subunit delta
MLTAHFLLLSDYSHTVTNYAKGATHMPIYLFWGEDDFALTQAVTTLREQTLDPNWESFNFDRIPPEQPDGIIQALNQAMTPPFGFGKRLVWLVETGLLQQCSEEVLGELERTLPQVPESTVLLLTSSKKPDGRLKSTKLLQKHAEIREFALIPPWKTDQLQDRVKQMAKDQGVRLSIASETFLAEAIGNNTRQLHTELEKLRLYAGASSAPLELTTVTNLVTTSTQNSLQLASTIRIGDVSKALELVQDLINRNEPPLRIVATLVGQFRTWLWVKVMVEAGERDDKAIAAAAEVNNPKRIYFLKQEIRHLSLNQLLKSLPLLLELESGLKQGQDGLALLQTKVIELCELCRSDSMGSGISSGKAGRYFQQYGRRESKSTN